MGVKEKATEKGLLKNIEAFQIKLEAYVNVNKESKERDNIIYSGPCGESINKIIHLREKSTNKTTIQAEIIIFLKFLENLTNRECKSRSTLSTANIIIAKNNRPNTENTLFNTLHGGAEEILKNYMSIYPADYESALVQVGKDAVKNIRAEGDAAQRSYDDSRIRDRERQQTKLKDKKLSRKIESLQRKKNNPGIDKKKLQQEIDKLQKEHEEVKRKLKAIIEKQQEELKRQNEEAEQKRLEADAAEAEQTRKEKEAAAKEEEAEAARRKAAEEAEKKLQDEARQKEEAEQKQQEEARKKEEQAKKQARRKAAEEVAKKAINKARVNIAEEAEFEKLDAIFKEAKIVTKGNKKDENLKFISFDHTDNETIQTGGKPKKKKKRTQKVKKKSNKKKRKPKRKTMRKIKKIIFR